MLDISWRTDAAVAVGSFTVPRSRLASVLLALLPLTANPSRVRQVHDVLPKDFGSVIISFV